MIKEATGVADTVEEALEIAKAQLNAPETADISFDVLEQPSKKILGIFGGSKASVRAYYEIPDEKPERKERKTHDVKRENIKKEKAVKEVKEEKVSEEPVLPAEDRFSDYSEPVAAETVDKNSSAGKAVAYISVILEKLGCKNVKISVREREGAALLLLEGDDLGVAIGRRGETLDALQYLCSLASNIGNGYYKVTIDIGDFRERREQSLVGLAKKVASQVLATGRSRSLEPMNPYERRIIHTTVQTIAGVTSNSVGEGSSRHIIISPEGGDRHPHGNGRGRGHGGYNNRHSNEVKSDISREPKHDSESLPLYGKIN